MDHRKIIHIDMDSFYAAVEVKHRPELKGLPIGVGGPANSRSVLTTASYEARKFGVRSAMPCSQAVRLCPQLILIPPNFELYKKESQSVRRILERFTKKIEPLSLDEAYLDVTESEWFGGSATLLAQEIRRLIKEELQLVASAGVSGNKFLAKIASDWRKPDGLFVIRPEDIESFMPPLKVNRIYGVGQVTAKKLNELGLFTCGDIQKYPLHKLIQYFGNRGEELQKLSFGIDEREVQNRSERKSLTIKKTFAKDIDSEVEGLKQIGLLYKDWESRMKKLKSIGPIRSAVVKLKFHDFTSTTHERAIREWPTPDVFERLFAEAWQRRGEPVRLIGLGVRMGESSESKKDPHQLSLGLL